VLTMTGIAIRNGAVIFQQGKIPRDCSCCGCLLSTLQSIYDTIASSNCSIQVAGTAPRNEAGSYLFDKSATVCRISQASGENKGTFEAVQNYYGANGANAPTLRHRAGVSPIGTFQMAFVPAESVRPGINATGSPRAVFAYEDVLLKVRVEFSLSGSAIASRWWPGTSCGVFASAAVDIFGQRAVGTSDIQIGFLGPDLIDEGFFGTERSFAYVKSDTPSGFWASDFGQNWSGVPLVQATILYFGQATAPISGNGGTYVIAFPQQDRVVSTWGWSAGPPSPVDFSYNWKYTGQLAGGGRWCQVELTGQEPATGFNLRITPSSVTPTITLTAQ